MLRWNGYKFDFQGNNVLAFKDQGTSGISEWTTFPFLNDVIELFVSSYGVHVCQKDGSVDLISGGLTLTTMYVTSFIPAPNRFWEGSTILRSVEPGGKYILTVSRSANANVADSLLYPGGNFGSYVKKAFKNLGAQVEVIFIDGNVNTETKLERVA